MTRLTVARTVRIPDPARLALFQRAPEFGPKILFFSGGSALRSVSKRIIDYTRNSIHLITPFDSGGSSAKLREAFQMLAVGDLRNRLMALADRSFQGNPEVFELFAYRFPNDLSQVELREWLARMVAGKEPMIEAIPAPMRRLVRNHLGYFADAMPESFDLRGANIGNLILTGGFLNQHRHIDPVIYLFSRLVNVRGIVRPMANEYLHLAAELADGSILVGQHLITGKEASPLASPVKRLFLTASRENPVPYKLKLREKIQQHIATADLICFPIGSFYSSVVANLLQRGLGNAVAEVGVPKVYIPNLGADPEQLGMSLGDQVETLVGYLQRSHTRGDLPPAAFLSFVLFDGRHHKPAASDLARIEKLGISAVDLPLVSEESQGLLDAQRIVEALLSMA